MRRLTGALRQPLPYFVLLGAVVFCIDLWLRGTPQTLEISSAVRAEVAARLQQQLSRPPKKAELQRGVEEWVNTELLFREALALGLDENDTVIREHLAQKLRHIVRERAMLEEPTDAELRARFDADSAHYSSPRTFDVTHAFIQRSVAPASYRTRVDEALAKLVKGDDPRTVGDNFPRGPKFTKMTVPQLEGIFDTKLTAVLDPRRIGQWRSVESSRGAHLIRLDAVSPKKPDFESLRPVLAADVQERKKQAAVQAYLKELRKKYTLDSRASH